MNEAEIARLRLRAQRLVGRPCDGGEHVVGWLGAVQSQEYRLARWSIGQRAAGVSERHVDRLLADGRIMRTHVLRPTWHFVLPTDIRWMMALTGPRIAPGMRRRMKGLGLSESVLTRALDVIVAALRGGRRLTRAQIGVLLGEAGIDAAAGRLAYITAHGELELVLCSGGLDGRQQTYALLDERVPGSGPMPREEAIAELVRRYFASHGPSTIRDFTWWSSLTLTDTKLGLEQAGGELESVTVDGREYWFSPAALDGAAAGTPVVVLVQTFDEYIVGYQHSRGVIDVARLSGPGTWNPNSFTNPILVDGQICGGWRVASERDVMTVGVRLLRDLRPAEERALEAAVERYRAFSTMPVDVQLRGDLAGHGLQG